MSTKHQRPELPGTSLRVVWATALATLMVLGSSILGTGLLASAANSPYGIVPLGSTNEGLPGGATTATTGILDISGGPCVGPVIKNQKADRLATRITLYHGAAVVARWEIYGAQRIAWVEPAGHYSVTASDFRNGERVPLVVTTTTNATANLNPGCL